MILSVTSSQVVIVEKVTYLYQRLHLYKRWSDAVPLRYNEVKIKSY